MRWIVEAETMDDLAQGRYAIQEELIRCEDCMHNIPSDEDDPSGACDINAGIWYPDDFCSFSEKKEKQDVIIHK